MYSRTVSQRRRLVEAFDGQTRVLHPEIRPYKLYLKFMVRGSQKRKLRFRSFTKRSCILAPFNCINHIYIASLSSTIWRSGRSSSASTLRVHVYISRVTAR